MKKILFLLTFIIQLHVFAQIDNAQFVFTDTIHSQYLDKSEVINIYLPPDYYETNDSYPLQVVLGKYSRTKMYASISEYLSRTYHIVELEQMHTIPESIVVGLGHAQKDNMEDYYKFVHYEVLPLVEAKYRKCHYKSVIGHSRDGEFVLYSLFNDSSPFHAYFCTAPSNSAYFISELNNENTVAKLQEKRCRLFFVASQQDYFYEENIKLISALNRFADSSFVFKSKISNTDNHHTIFPVSITDALFFMFEEWHFRTPDIEGVSAHFVEKYHQLSASIGQSIAPPEFDFYLLAYILDVRGRMQEKIKLLEKCIELYPEAKNAHAYIARTYFSMGDFKNATLYNDSALKIDPRNEFAIETKDLIIREL